MHKFKFLPLSLADKEIGVGLVFELWHLIAFISILSEVCNRLEFGLIDSDG